MEFIVLEQDVHPAGQRRNGVAYVSGKPLDRERLVSEQFLERPTLRPPELFKETQARFLFGNRTVIGVSHAAVAIFARATSTA
jgi:hypothetical protein